MANSNTGTANLTVPGRVTRCPVCNAPVHQLAQGSVWACTNPKTMHYWVPCRVHDYRWALWSGECGSDVPARNCQCHLDDGDTDSEYVTVEWYRMDNIQGKVRYSLHATEVMPRALIARTTIHGTLVPRTRWPLSDAAATHILSTPERYTASVFATVYPLLTWQQVQQWHTAAKEATAPL